MKNSFIIFVFALTYFVVNIHSACAAELRLALHWLPQAQFAGYYVAQEKGFYDEAGLEVKILHGGADQVPADRLNSGEIHFSTMFLAAAIERRDAGIPIVNVAQIVQRSSLMILTKKSDGISTIEDLDGQKLATWASDFQIQPWALFKKHDIDVMTVPFSGSMELFLKGAVPATLAMWYNGYHSVLSAGYKENEIQPFYFKDTDFDFPEDGIYCLENFADNNPMRVKAFVTATIKGWEYAFKHEDEALKIVNKKMKEANAPFSEVHQRWMLKIMNNIMQPKDSETPYGHLSENVYGNVIKTIVDTGFTDQIIDYEDFVWSGLYVQ